MTKTSNYQLNQWEPTDKLSRTDFNRDNAAIDAALANKAEKSAVTAVENALANYKTGNDAALAAKAETTALAALQNSLNATNSNVSALSAALGSGGSNCRIATGSYVGTGTYGPSNPTSITVPFKPIWVMIARSALDDTETAAPAKTYTSFLLRPMTAASSTYPNGLYVTWGDRGVRWYCNEGISNAHLSQNNTKGYTHYWVAIGVDE